MGLLDVFKKKKPTMISETERRAHLTANGRITDGTVIENSDENERTIVFYIYSVHGADYESSEILGAEQLADPLKYAPGAKVGVRYDPKQHGNSMLV